MESLGWSPHAAVDIRRKNTPRLSVILNYNDNSGCFIRMWQRKVSWRNVRYSQWGQGCGFSPVWVCLWLIKPWCELNVLRQNSQMYTRRSSRKLSWVLPSSLEMDSCISIESTDEPLGFPWRIPSEITIFSDISIWLMDEESRWTYGKQKIIDFITISPILIRSEFKGKPPNTKKTWNYTRRIPNSTLLF